MDRKQFLTWLVASAASLACAPRAPRRAQGADRRTDSAELPLRKLGATGVEVTRLGLGGYHLGMCGSEREARAVVDAALEEGVRFFDTAESYQRGKSERWLGSALRGVRDDVFLMSKTFSLDDRSAESAKRHLEGTLERLGTDRLDLWQLHSIRSAADVDRAFRPGGAMEYILEQKARGVVRFVGVTGHADPAAHLRAIELWDEGMRYDCMQLPLNPIDFHQKSFQTPVLPLLVERDIAVLAMKTSAQGRLVRDRICSIEECLRFVWSLPVSVAIVGMESVELVRANARLARGAEAYGPAEIERLLARVEPRKSLELEWYKRG